MWGAEGGPYLGPFCFTSTEAKWLIRNGDGRGRGGRKSEGSTADTARKRPERPWTAARTMEVLRRCPLAIAQRLIRSAIAVSTAVLGRVTKTMSIALLLGKPYLVIKPAFYKAVVAPKIYSNIVNVVTLHIF